MNIRFRKASAVFASVAILAASALAMLAVPASAATPCQAGCVLGITGVGLNGGSTDLVDNTSLELGLQFHVLAAGAIDSIRFYMSPTEAANQPLHAVRLFRVSGPGGPAGLMQSSAIQGGVSGVNSYALLAPALVTVGDVYIASYGSGTAFGYNDSAPSSQLPKTVNTLVGDKGIFSNGAGSQPTTSVGNDYGVDPHFVEAPSAPVITSVTFGTNTSASVAFSNDGAVSGTSYSVSCTTSGLPTATGSGSASPITANGFIPGSSYSCTVTASNIGGSATSAPFVTPGIGAPGTGESGPGCATTSLSAPTKLSSASEAFPGAQVSWAPAEADPSSCLAGYLVTPLLDGTTAQPAVFVVGHGTTTLIKPLTLGALHVHGRSRERFGNQ